MDQKILNSDMLKELTSAQICELMANYWCLACVTGRGRPCGITEFSLKCITGYDMWMEAEADPENWQNIRNALHIPPKND